MAYNATVYNVMIASPSDVLRERQVARDVIHEWNAVHAEDRNVVLMALGWETHSPPAMGDRPQALINQQVLDRSDLLIAVFWTRIGTPTGESPSGTVEEIRKHVDAGKPAMVYFSSAPVKLDSVDQEQYKALCEFRETLKSMGLYETYDDVSDFQKKLSRQLAQTVIRYFIADAASAESAQEFARENLSVPTLTTTAKRLLLEVAQDKNGRLMMVRSLGGMFVQTNGKNFVEQGNPRSEALWEGAVRELCRNGLFQECGSKGEVFSITTEGYLEADVLRRVENQTT